MTNLRELALDLLGKHGNNPLKAQPPFDRALKKNLKLRKQLETEYLETIAKGLAVAETQRLATLAQDGDQTPCVTQNEGVAIHLSTDVAEGQRTGENHRNVASAKDGGDQLAIDTQLADVATIPPNPERTVPIKPYKVKGFWRHPERTEAEKEMARITKLTSSSVLHRFGMDKLRYHELDAFIRENAQTGNAHIWQGINNVQRAALASLIRRHATPPDTTMFVRDMISDADLTKLEATAIAQAPKLVGALIARGTKQLAKDVERITAE